jgi:hypothetical protein
LCGSIVHPEKSPQKEMFERKIIIAGGRDFNDTGLMEKKITFLLSELIKQGTKVVIVSGTARGADRLGEAYAVRHGLEVKPYPADWNKYGKSAGYKRNEQMADIADGLIAFWDGKSRGTKHMIDTARRKGLQVKVINY